MLDIRLIATDLDGTLFGDDATVTRENARALRECAARGIIVMLASGRSFEAVREIALDIGLDQPIMTTNGARLDANLSGRGTIVYETIPPDKSRAVYELIKGSGLIGRCFTTGFGYVINGELLQPDRYPRGASDKRGFRYEYVYDEERLLREGADRALKYTCGSREPEKLAPIRDGLIALDLEVNSAFYTNVETLKKGVNKGTSLEKFARLNGIAKEQIMAFGDFTNDLAMLGAAGWPVAMENGADEVKAAARIIAPDHDASGVAQVLDQYVLGVRQ